jgi:hypothetical protein
MEAYAHTRAERPDANLLVRARLSAEMRQLSELMGAVSGGDRVLTERLASGLRRLEDRVHAEEESDNDYHHTGLSPARPATRVVVPPAVVEDEADDPDDDVEEMFARTAPDEPDPEDVAPGDVPPQDVVPEDAGADPVDHAPGERTEEIDVSTLRGSQPVDGPDPGPDFEPGYRP